MPEADVRSRPARPAEHRRMAGAGRLAGIAATGVASLKAARGSAEIPEGERQQGCRSAGRNNFRTELQSHFASLDAH